MEPLRNATQHCVCALSLEGNLINCGWKSHPNTAIFDGMLFHRFSYTKLWGICSQKMNNALNVGNQPGFGHKSSAPLILSFWHGNVEVNEPSSPHIYISNGLHFFPSNSEHPPVFSRVAQLVYMEHTGKPSGQLPVLFIFM